MIDNPGSAYLADTLEAGREQHAPPGHPPSIQKPRQKRPLDGWVVQALEQGKEEGGTCTVGAAANLFFQRR